MKKTKQPVFSVKFTIADQIYEGTGASVLEALQAVPKPVKITGKAYLQVTDGTRSKNMPLTVERTKRFFYPIAQIYVAKMLAQALK